MVLMHDTPFARYLAQAHGQSKLEWFAPTSGIDVHTPANGCRKRHIGSGGDADVVDIEHDGTGVFPHQPGSLKLTRYNSLVAVENGEHSLLVNATESTSGLIMGLRHPTLEVHGVQFHPESIGSRDGQRLIHQFLTGESDG